MKILKKIFIVFLFVLLSTALIKTKGIGYNTQKNASFEVNETVKELNTLYTTYKQDVGTTIFNGNSSNQHVFMLSQKETNDSKIVTWAVSDEHGALTRTTLTGIAKDYEAHHPDYCVIGGINGDQFTLGFGENLAQNGRDPYHLQSYYPFICDNEGWFIVTAMPNSGGKFAIMHTDGRTNSLEYLTNAHPISGLFLYILNKDGERIQKFRVDHFNETPRGGETSVFSSHYDLKANYPTITLHEKNLYVIKNAEKCLPNNSIDYVPYKDNYAQDGFFGKGVITNVNNLNTIGFGDFAISTFDPNLMEYLNVGTKVLVQFEYQGLDNIESAIGFHTIQRENGVDNIIPASDAYNNRKYPRSIIGAKDNGDFVLIAIDGLQENKGASGACFEEINAILDNYGVATAYQMDGGGSVTAIVRNDKGSFDTVNSPSDGQPRTILNGVFFVERRKPTGELKIQDNNINDITFNIDINDYNNIINNQKLIINEKEYIINDNEITIEGIERNKTIPYTIEFNITNGNGEEEIVKVNKELFIPNMAPYINYCKWENNETLNIEIKDIDDVLIDSYILNNGVRYDILGNVCLIPSYNNDILYLKISYFDGLEEKFITIIYPDKYPLNRMDSWLDSINSSIFEMRVFN